MFQPFFQRKDAAMKKLSTLIIVMGLIIAAYPLLERGYWWYSQQKLLEDFEEHITLEAAAMEAYYELETIFNDEMEQDQGLVSPTNPPDQQEEEKPIEVSALDTIGRILIQKIELNLPILAGATNRNLKMGAAQIEGTTTIGEIGNTALAGHRSHTFGRLFNRLDELEPGDMILIETINGIYEYEVYEKKVVLPEDVSVLNRNNQDRVLTLITCTPLYTASHRLIIHAKQTET